MLIFNLFISFALAANGDLFTLSEWSLPNDPGLDSLMEKSDTDFMKKLSSPGPYSSSGALFDDPENPLFEPANLDLDDHGSASSAPSLAGTISPNGDCESYEDGLQPSRKRPRAAKFCPTDQNIKNNQQDAAGERSDEGSTGSDIPKGDDTNLFHLPDSIPLVDFNSIDRNIGYCPEFFYGLLAIPVCASADPAFIKKALLILL